MNNKNTKLVMGIICLSAIIILTTSASAVFWQCFQRGEIIDFCNEDIRDRTCSGTRCLYCMNTFDEVNSCYTHAFLNRCNQMTPDCSRPNQANIDTEPPTLLINSPIQDEIYTDKSIIMDIQVSERSHISYLDNQNTRRRRPTRLCRNCDSYGRTRRFKEGFNNIKFLAEDVVGNGVQQNISFFIDTKLPKINRVEPRKGLSSGFFNLEFTENNPKTISLYYGNSQLGFSTHNLDIESDCNLNRRRYSCSSFINIESYNNQELTFWFNVSDIAKKSSTSRPYTVQVDTEAPIVNSLDFTINRRKVEFSINISEANLKKVEFRDNSIRRPRWKRLCTRLRDGLCTKRLSFRQGIHNLDIQISDKAGNVISNNIEFTI